MALPDNGQGQRLSLRKPQTILPYVGGNSHKSPAPTAKRKSAHDHPQRAAPVPCAHHRLNHGKEIRKSHHQHDNSSRQHHPARGKNTDRLCGGKPGNGPGLRFIRTEYGCFPLHGEKGSEGDNQARSTVKEITSPMLSAPSASITTRSTPSATPEQSGKPASRAASRL